MSDTSEFRPGIHRIADALSGEVKPLGEARWAEIHERLWVIIDELREGNDMLKLSLLLHADRTFSN
jgi:hypothetical protein